MASSNLSFGLTKIVGRIFLLLLGALVAFSVYIFIFHDGMFGTEFLSDDDIKAKVSEQLYIDYAIRNPNLVLVSKETYTSCFDPSSMTCNVERDAFNVYIYTYSGVGVEGKTMTVTYRSPFLRHFIPNEAELEVKYPSARNR